MKEYLNNILIGFSSPGPTARRDNGLEALLAACRVFGWMYEITKETTGKYTVELRALSAPTDYYWPCIQRCSICVVGVVDPYDGLVSAMCHVQAQIVNNGWQFRNSFVSRWEMVTRKTWAANPETIEVESLCAGEMK